MSTERRKLKKNANASQEKIYKNSPQELEDVDSNNDKKTNMEKEDVKIKGNKKAVKKNKKSAKHQQEEQEYPNEGNQPQQYAAKNLYPTKIVRYGMMKLKTVKNPYEELLDCEEVEINQKFEFLELIGGCEMPNEYLVLKHEPGIENPKYLFKVCERASGCCLNCVKGRSRTKSLELQHVQYDMYHKTYRELVKAYHQKWQCCDKCCCNRPELFELVDLPKQLNNNNADKNNPIDINVENANKIRVMSNPYYCCDYVINIYSDAGQLIYKVYGNYNQCGIACGKTFGACSDVCFDIICTKDDPNSITPVGKITKQFKMASLVTDQDFYHLHFPPDADIEERLKLVFATVFLDFLYYEDKDAGVNTDGAYGGYGRFAGHHRIHGGLYGAMNVAANIDYYDRYSYGGGGYARYNF